MKDVVNRDFLLRATKAWDDHLAKLDESSRREIFSDFNKYLKAYADFINGLKMR